MADQLAGHWFMKASQLEDDSVSGVDIYTIHTCSATHVEAHLLCPTPCLPPQHHTHTGMHIHTHTHTHTHTHNTTHMLTQIKLDHSRIAGGWGRREGQGKGREDGGRG